MFSPSAGVGLLLVLCCTSDGSSISIYWDVDQSDTVVTPKGVLVGDHGRSCPWNAHHWCDGQNGMGTNIYGNRGDMPHFASDGSAVNGGIPQAGNLTLHLTKFKADFAALVPEPTYAGICLLDYEFFRADWNSTTDQMRTASISAAGGDAKLAKVQYEHAAKRFMLGTLQAAKALRPGCKYGYYGYPRNDLPTAAGDTPAYQQYCKAHPFDCTFAGYGNTTAGDAQRRLNDALGWLWSASDVLTPSVYLGKLPSQQNSRTHAESAEYVRQTVTEANRLAKSHPQTEVVAVAWYFYDNYPRTPTWTTLTQADLQIELHGAIASGADGLLLWGAVDNSTMTTARLQHFVDSTLTPVVSGICAQYGCTLPPRA